MNPLISIVTPFKGRLELLLETLDSVKRQTYKNLEIILIDDGSREPFEDLIKQALDQYRYKLLRNESSKGPGYSRQKGVENSSGKYVVYLDSDDILHADMIAECVKLLEADSDLGMCYVRSLEFYKSEDLKNPANLKTRKRSDQRISENLIFEILNQKRVWDTSACMWRKSALANFYPWISSEHMEDYAYDVQVEAQGLKVGHIARPLCYYRNHLDSVARLPLRRHGLSRIEMLVACAKSVEASAVLCAKTKKKNERMILSKLISAKLSYPEKIAEEIISGCPKTMRFVLRSENYLSKLVLRALNRFRFWVNFL